MEAKIKKELQSLPRRPGVYLFKGERGQVLYIGKATSLRDRVRSYFSGHDSRGERIRQLVALTRKIDFYETPGVLEALILESNLIHEYQPKYNVEGKDDKSFSYFVITQEEFPRVLIVRETDLGDYSPRSIFGPYKSQKQMRAALKIMRRIFPFHALKQKTEKGCLDYQMGFCPGPYDGGISKQAYKKNIHAIRQLLKGKKKSLVKQMRREMKEVSDKQDFERAARLRDQIRALRHLRDVALIEKEPLLEELGRSAFRIEAYDISNIGGRYAAGSMVVFHGTESQKSEYRKFKIQTISGINDVGAMEEVLKRRFSNDWPVPDLIVLDGGKGHWNRGKEVLKNLGFSIPLIAVAKGPTRKKLDIYKDSIGDTRVQKWLKNLKNIERVRDEAHRFAITYHRKLREKI